MPYIISMLWIPEKEKIVSYKEGQVITQIENKSINIIQLNTIKFNTAKAGREAFEGFIKAAESQIEYDESMYLRDETVSMSSEFAENKNYPTPYTLWKEKIKQESQCVNGQLYEVVQRVKNYSNNEYSVLFREEYKAFVWSMEEKEFLNKYERV